MPQSTEEESLAGGEAGIDTPEDMIAYDDVQDDLNVVDETENEPQTVGRFSITSYGADLSVFDLRRRLGREILIPAPFQRKFVWTTAPSLALHRIHSSGSSCARNFCIS